MKKFISMVMAAAMVISLVPATAFADTGSAKAVAKVIDSADIAKDADEDAMKDKKTELQLKVDGDGQYATGTTGEHKLTFTLDGAEFPYIIKIEYTVDGKAYTKRKWINAGDPVPKVGSNVQVMYNSDKPSKARIL